MSIGGFIRVIKLIVRHPLTWRIIHYADDCLALVNHLRKSLADANFDEREMRELAERLQVLLLNLRVLPSEYINLIDEITEIVLVIKGRFESDADKGIYDQAVVLEKATRRLEQ